MVSDPPVDQPAPNPAAVPPVPPVESPLEVETAFLTSPTDAALEDQRERLRLLMDRGALVVLLVAAITFFAAVINSLRGNFQFTHWIFPVVAVLMGVGLYFGAERMASRPDHAVEVPADLASVLNDLTIARGEVIATAPRVLNPDELTQVLSDTQERHTAAFSAAQETLKALRAGDIERASALGTEVYRHTDIIEHIRDDLQGEWEASTPIPEGYIGDVEAPEVSGSRRSGLAEPGYFAAPVQPTEPGYPASYPVEPSSPVQPPPSGYSTAPVQPGYDAAIPAAEASRAFWSRPDSTQNPSAAPRPDEGRSGRSSGPVD
ncbi:MAG: hypothetical protein DLM55_07405 [Acidimicrobiales bacterium]|nr:MAG: hypothetical protein DLM55_07405 [Acidimicrobiales bacterium]